MNTVEPKVVVIGGGTGSISILTGLKDRAHVTAIVNMADDGGSTGVLREELGVLPAGDVWKCLGALSDSSKLRELFSYRFTEGSFKGHSVGNILMAACEKMNGNFNDAVQMVSEILHIHGSAIPVTLDNVRLRMEWPDTDVVLNGEHVIDVEKFIHDPRQAKLSLVPGAQANPAAIAAIREADIIIVAAGDLYTSLGPQLVIEEVGRALREASALKVYVANLIKKPGHTDMFTVADHADEIERFAGGEFLDYVLYNQPNEQTDQSDVTLVPADERQLVSKHYKTVPGQFMGAEAKQDTSEAFSVAARSQVRHDPTAVADAIMNLYDQTRNT